MSRPLNPVNYAEVTTTTTTVDMDSGVSTTVANYVVGWYDVTTSTKHQYNHPAFLGVGNGNTVTVTGKNTDDHLTTAVAVQNAIAAAEGIDLAAGEHVFLPA